MRTFVIGLRSCTERREWAQRELERAGTPFTFFDAYEGDAGRVCFRRIDDRAFLIATGRHVIDREIGCFASHRALWQRCVALDEPVLILEDDLSLAANFSAALDYVQRWLPATGLIRLQNETRGRKALVSADHDFQLNVYLRAPLGAMAYALTPAVAADLVSASRVLRAPVDRFLAYSWEHGQPMFGLTPHVVSESERAWCSTIGERVKAKKPLATRAARLQNKVANRVKRLVFNRRCVRDRLRQLTPGDPG